VGQSIYFGEKSFGQTYWTSPVATTKVHPRKVQVQTGQNKTCWLYNNRIALNSENFQHTEGSIESVDLESEHQFSQLIQQQIKHVHQEQEDKIRAIQALWKNLIKSEADRHNGLIKDEAKLVSTVLPLQYLRYLSS